MKKCKLWFAALLLTLCGCSASPVIETEMPATETSAATETTLPVTEAQTKTKPETRPLPTETEPPTTEPEPPAALPVLSITTIKQGENALDFVTKPVVRYVAETAASWSPDYRMPPEPFDEACTVTLTDTDSTVLLEDADADIRVRGNWTTYYDKKPLRIRFAEKQELLGLHDAEKMRSWVLLAEYKDPSLLRNKTALSLSREILGADELYAADAALVEVQINGEYWGVYLLTEQQQVNKHRIDITKPEKDSTDTKIGYFLEYDGYYTYEDALHQFRVDYADNAPLTPFDGNLGSFRKLSPLNTGYGDRKKNVGFTIKSDIYAQEQHDFIASYINNVYKVLYAAAYEDTAYQFNETLTEISKAEITPQEAVEAVIDVQSLADMYVISELLCDADINWSSFFMDVDFGENGSGKLTFEAPWDFDSAMGNQERPVVGKGFFAANIVPDANDEYDTINPWLTVLIYEDWFQERIRETWTNAYDSGVFDRAFAMISHDAAEYAEAFERNCARWNDTCENGYESGKCEVHEKAADELLGWLRARVDFLNSWWHT